MKNLGLSKDQIKPVSLTERNSPVWEPEVKCPYSFTIRPFIQPIEKDNLWLNVNCIANLVKTAGKAGFFRAKTAGAGFAGTAV
jgi:hypothetical protein